jgi:hypothetical protein
LLVVQATIRLEQVAVEVEPQKPETQMHILKVEMVAPTALQAVQ